MNNNNNKTTQESRNSHELRASLVEKYLKNDVITTFKDYAHMTAEEMAHQMKVRGTYTPVYSMGLIAHMSKGHTFQSFAALVSVSTNTLTGWAKRHSEFGEAREIGTAKSLAHWEDKLEKGITMEQEVDARLLILKLKNEYADFYVDNEDGNVRPTEIHIHTGVDEVVVDEATITMFNQALESSGYKAKEEDSKYASESTEESAGFVDFIDVNDYSSNNNEDDMDLL